MSACDVLDAILSLLRELPVYRVALVAGVTLVAAGIIYLLVDAVRYNAIPNLHVPLSEG